MAAMQSGDDLAKSMSRRMSLASTSSRRSWASASVRDAFAAPDGDVFQRSGREDDEVELKWAAIERLPTYDRLRKGMMKQVLENGKIVHQEVDVANLGLHDRKQLVESILKVVEEDNERFLLRLRERTDRRCSCWVKGTSYSAQCYPEYHRDCDTEDILLSKGLQL